MKTSRLQKNQSQQVSSKKIWVSKIVNSSNCLDQNKQKYLRGVFSTLSNIYDEVSCENNQQLKVVNYYSRSTLSMKHILLW